jgi:hypothetical protein
VGHGVRGKGADAFTKPVTGRACEWITGNRHHVVALHPRHQSPAALSLRRGEPRGKLAARDGRGEIEMKIVQVPQGWPSDRPLAVSVSVMLEGWEAPDAPGMGPMGNVLRPGTVDLQARSWADYGAKVGAWRLLDLLE